jgi:hypothetical protein
MPTVTVVTQPVYGVPCVVKGGLVATIKAIPSLVGYWRLNETSGTVIHDSGPKLLHGSAGAGVTLAQGRLTPSDRTADSCLFNGSSTGHITIPANAGLDLGDTLTVMALIRPTGSTSRGIVSKGNNAYYIRVSNNDPGALLLIKGQVALIGTTAVPIAASTIHHVAWTKAGATNKAYTDGADVTPAITNATLANSAYDLFIGSDNVSGTAGDYYTGRIAEVALFSTALSGPQIAEIARLALL